MDCNPVKIQMSLNGTHTNMHAGDSHFNILTNAKEESITSAHKSIEMMAKATKTNKTYVSIGIAIKKGSDVKNVCVLNGWLVSWFLLVEGDGQRFVAKITEID